MDCRERMTIFCNKLSKWIWLLQWTNELCKQEQSMKRDSGGENEGPGIQSIPWEPLTHAKLQSPGLELPARPSNCLQVPGETTKTSNCEEIWRESVFSEKKVSLKKCHFGRGGFDTIQPVPSMKSLVLYGCDIKKTNKQERNNIGFRC